MEIKIGETLAYSGPASSSATIGRTPSAYYRMVNVSETPGGYFCAVADNWPKPSSRPRRRTLKREISVMF
jgi:hypothetical protein